MGNHIFHLCGKTAVVIGGTSGIGHAITLGLARAGADVVAASRRAAEVERTAVEIAALGRRSLALTTDVLDRASLEALHAQVMEVFGRVDILVNSAGITRRTPGLPRRGMEQHS
jgi:NAD(P)-dependent dehydrogenase (short-subunit alcohol dehydrogenase family)